MLLTLRRTEYSISPRKSVKPVIQIVLANIIMTTAIVYPHLTFLVAVPVAAIVYVVALLITGGINREDREIVLDFIDKFRNRNRW